MVCVLSHIKVIKRQDICELLTELSILIRNCEMARPDDKVSNALFESLESWNSTLKAENIDPDVKKYKNRNHLTVGAF